MDQPQEYKKLALTRHEPRALRETAEGKYWRHFSKPVFLQQIGAVSHVNISPCYPYEVAVTSSTRVLVYDKSTAQVKRQFTRFKDKAYSGTFRGDGKLLVAGGEDGIVQVFDGGSRAVLRLLKGHQAACHATRFAPDGQHVLSAADDTTVRWWDVAAGEQLFRLEGHTDYVRSAAANPASPDVWATGGYDHVCRLWDVRSQQGLLSLDHGAPVEDVAFLPSGTLAVTAGGTSVCIWDILGGGRLLARLDNHQKTVTCLRVAAHAGPASSAAPRLLTGSLDKHVKVYELEGYRVTHAQKYPSPILSLDIAPDCSTLAVGQADGLLCLRKHSAPKAAAIGAGGAPPKRPVWTRRLTAATPRYFVRGQGDKPDPGEKRTPKRRPINLKPYDRHLRKFEYREALDATLQRGRPEIVVALCDELVQRGGLEAAVGGRDSAGLEPLLQFVTKHLTDPRYSSMLTAVAHTILDLYAIAMGRSETVDRKLELLRERVMLELRLHSDLQQLQGMLAPLVAAP
eukprot:jgi/Astpho2/2672/fgenesh1_pm.00049_%23_14_t